MALWFVWLLACTRGAPASDPHRWLTLEPSARVSRLARELRSDLRYLALRDARLRFLEAAPAIATEARPILFVHGLGGGLADFGPVMVRAREASRVIALDLPGFGGSTSLDRDYSVSGSVNVLAAFIERLELAPVRLACHSLGGQICLALALERRHLVHDLTLVAPAGIYRREDFVRETSRRFGVNIGEVVMSDPARSFAAVLTHGDDVVLRRLVAEDPLTIAALASFRENLHDRLREIRAPMTIIWGARDRVLPMSDGFALAASAAKATLRVVEDAGHLPQLTHPEKVHAWMQQAIDSRSRHFDMDER